MGKRSSFGRVERDFYPTPIQAVAPLIPHLFPGTAFCEPCAGDGRLIDHLEAYGHRCATAWDIHPQREDIKQRDATYAFFDGGFDCFITNPPWSRPVLHSLIVALSDQKPVWLLFDSDWVHTRQSAPFMSRLRKIVSVGRVKWIEDSPYSGKDNCSWHLFDRPSREPAVFVGRVAGSVKLPTGDAGNWPCVIPFDGGQVAAAGRETGE